MRKGVIPFWEALVVAIVGAGAAAFAMIAIDVIFQQWLLDNLVNAYVGNADFGLFVLLVGILIAGFIAILTSLLVAKYVAEVRDSGRKLFALALLALAINLMMWLFLSYGICGTVEGYAVPVGRAMMYLVYAFPGGVNLYWAVVAISQMVIFAILMWLFGIQVKLPVEGKKVGYRVSSKHKKHKNKKHARRTGRSY